MNEFLVLVLWITGHTLYTLGAIYYLIVLLPAYINGKKHYVTNSAPSITDIQNLMKTKKLNKIPLFKFQITTKGNEIHVVKRGIKSILNLNNESIFKNRLRIDIVTEDPFDKRKILLEFKDCQLPLNIYIVPLNYKTKNNTMRKARALHYMIEIRKKEIDIERGYIVYFDSESVINPIDFRRIVFNIIKDEKKITEGPIVYPLRWFEAPLISRQMEATRPWNCYHCHKVMTNPPPQHLHGSNLVVEENLALDLGWDFGNIDGQPFIAEDFVFGFQAYIKYGRSVFGWHGGELLEQPPMSIKDSIRQRIRWITGVWQGLEMIKRSKDYYKLTFIEKFKIRRIIAFRAILYSLGFIASIFFFYFMSAWVSNIYLNWNFFMVDKMMLKMRSIFLIPGFLMWFGSTQIGLHKILERKELSRKEKILEHIKILLITPIAAPIETFGAFYATMKWFLGFKKVEWIPTKK